MPQEVRPVGVETTFSTQRSNFIDGIPREKFRRNQKRIPCRSALTADMPLGESSSAAVWADDSEGLGIVDPF